MAANDYQPPVSELLTIGRPKGTRGKWFDYIEAYDFTQDHVPELVRLASEEDLDWQDDNDCFAVRSCSPNMRGGYKSFHFKSKIRFKGMEIK